MSGLLKDGRIRENVETMDSVFVPEWAPDRLRPQNPPETIEMAR
jgi:hypothetical protein